MAVWVRRKHGTKLRWIEMPKPLIDFESEVKACDAAGSHSNLLMNVTASRADEKS